MLTITADAEVELRILEPADAPALIALIDASREHLREWLPWVDNNRTAEDSLRFITGSLDKYGANTGLSMGVWYKGRLSGSIGFVNIDMLNRHAVIGYWLDSSLTGKGIMTRACKAMLDYAFDTMAFNRVEIYVSPGNAKSRAIPERLGFTNEGTLRKVEWLNDRFVDGVVYGMLREEWPEKKRAWEAKPESILKP
jgi:ribosomal-protein-serine acetyltransferase